MTERLFIGNDAGTFKMRLSRPGFMARNATVDQCVIHEQQSRPLMYVTQGYAVVAAGGTATVNLGRAFAFPPVLIVKHESHRTDAVRNVTLALNSGTLTLTVRSGVAGSLVKYVVMAPQ